MGCSSRTEAELLVSVGLSLSLISPRLSAVLPLKRQWKHQPRTAHPAGEGEEGVCQCRQSSLKSGVLNPFRTAYRRNTATMEAYIADSRFTSEMLPFGERGNPHLIPSTWH